MYLAAMENPSYRTIARFKVDYPDLINEAFKITIKIEKDNDLIKIHHMSLDGTKIKAKTSKYFVILMQVNEKNILINMNIHNLKNYRSETL